VLATSDTPKYATNIPVMHIPTDHLAVTVHAKLTTTFVNNSFFLFYLFLEVTSLYLLIAGVEAYCCT
jgi:hypothetical protein